eukprot:GHVT01025791.1.p1 GENE.GHVT01025791.1~~GHVT01025791.1.p1  ORF type:complete len:172 (-),score=12.89 GHVT01025791.1:199-714(-)
MCGSQEGLGLWEDFFFCFFPPVRFRQGVRGRGPVGLRVVCPSSGGAFVSQRVQPMGSQSGGPILVMPGALRCRQAGQRFRHPCVRHLGKVFGRRKQQARSGRCGRDTIQSFSSSGGGEQHATWGHPGWIGDPPRRGCSPLPMLNDSTRVTRTLGLSAALCLDELGVKTFEA